MGVHVLLQFFVLIFVVNPIALGALYQSPEVVILGRCNAIFLFRIAITQQQFFKKQAQTTGRVVFTPAIFFLLTVAVALTMMVGINQPAFATRSTLQRRELLIVISILFYRSCAALFRLYDPLPVRKVPVVRYLRSILGVICIVAAAHGIAVLVEQTPRSAVQYPPIRANMSEGVGRIRSQAASGRNDLRTVFLATGAEIGQDKAADDGDSNDFVEANDVNGTGATGNTVPSTIRPLADIPPSENTGAVQPAEDSPSEGPVFVTARTRDPLTYGMFLPLLVQTYALTAPANAQYEFTFVGAGSALYESFRIARYYAMIGTNLAPEAQMRCGNLMVLVGIAEKRTVGAGDVFQVYREQAVAKGYTAYGCDSIDTLATPSMLP